MKDVFSSYILASKRNGTLYTGVTKSLIERVWQHKTGLVEGFTKRYNVKILVYYQVHGSAYEAITEEKRMKRLSRWGKIRLIEESNPYWRDLYDGLF